MSMIEEQLLIITNSITLTSNHYFQSLSICPTGNIPILLLIIVLTNINNSIIRDRNTILIIGIIMFLFPIIFPYSYRIIKVIHSERFFYISRFAIYHVFAIYACGEFLVRVFTFKDLCQIDIYSHFTFKRYYKF